MAPKLGNRSSFCSLAMLVALVLIGPLQFAAADAAGGSARKLLATTITSDYTAYCSPPRVYSGVFSAGILAPFTTESDVLWNYDVCGLLPSTLVTLSGEPIFDTKVSGTFTETLISGGRRLSLAVKGSNVFLAGTDQAKNYTINNSTLNGERVFGVGAGGEGFVTYKPALSVAELQLVIGVATEFTYSLTWEVRDGSGFGVYNNLTYKDICYNPSKATFISEETTFTGIGPLRSTSLLKYPLGNLATVSIHQASSADRGGKLNPYVSDMSFDVLPFDERSARAEALMIQVIPKNLLVATVTGKTLYDPTVYLGGTGPGCDASGFSPSQCWASNGASYVCCPAPCLGPQGLTPKCV